MHDARINEDLVLRQTIDDEQRLAVLTQYGLDEGALEPSYTRLTRLLRERCNMDWAAVTIVGRDRQTFKARDGFDLHDTPRHVSFCSVAMHLSHPLIVEDARRDSRFARNPLVTGEPHIRFYAGFPIVSSEGFPLGALCVVNMQPCTLFPGQIDFLARARDWVKASLELRRLVRTGDEAGQTDESSTPLDQKLLRFARLRVERAWTRVIDRSKFPPLPLSQAAAPSDWSRPSIQTCCFGPASQPPAQPSLH